MFSCFNAGKLDRNDEFSTVANGDSATDLGMQSEHGEKLHDLLTSLPSPLAAPPSHIAGTGPLHSSVIDSD